MAVISVLAATYAVRGIEEERVPSPKTSLDDPAAILFSPAPVAEDMGRTDEEGEPALMRDPFWPVGYVPRREFPEEEEAALPHEAAGARELVATDWAQAARQLSVGGSMQRGDEWVALVNDRVVQAGDTVALVFKGHRLSWQVDTILRDGIRLRPLEAEPISP